LETHGHRVINLQDELDKVNRGASVASKEASGGVINDVEAQLLAEQDKLASLKENSFEPNPEKVAELKNKIKDFRTKVERTSGAAKEVSQRKLQEHSRALEDELSKASAGEKDNQQEILNSIRKIRELRTAKGQVVGQRQG